ncbi:MAG: M20/M25/M40 family metallo-hydrolase [Gammaproteobacteria bacterium]|nr:M20/M25/M40 family metallo-hydrolase [Gammaproteobacteria bacterium]
MKGINVLVLCALSALSQQAAYGDDRLAVELLSELVAINTAPSGGNDLRPAVDLLVTRLFDAGFDDDEIDIVRSGDKLPNLVVRLRSPQPQREPILMMAHLDVVEALPEDWTVAPFELTQSGGYFYGRGTTDNKAGAAILIANLIRMKRENFLPDRDLIVMLTADEETDGAGAWTLANEHRALIDAEFALNTDGGYVMLKSGRPRAFIMQTGEKVYVSYRLAATDRGGHSSLPRADSAISRIARTLTALDEFRFPVSLNETTRLFFERWRELAPAAERDLIDAVLAGKSDPETSASLDDAPYYNALARTTCIATQLSGGHAENAIPQSASAVVNCRVLPQFATTTAMSALAVMADPNNVTLEQIYPDRPSPPSPLKKSVVGPITEVASEFWPGIVVIPEMSTGATDGLFIRNVGIPVYAVSAIAEEPDEIRAHGKDERIGVEAFRTATEYWYQLAVRLATPN